MNTPTDLRQAAADAICGADFRSCWPTEVRMTLVRAAKTEGVIPKYAESLVLRALREAESVERRLARQIEAGESRLTHAERKARTKSSAA